MKLLRILIAVLILVFTWYVLLFVALCLFVIDLVEDFKNQRTANYTEGIVNGFEFVAGLNGRHRN